jgi:hypothetical protein
MSEFAIIKEWFGGGHAADTLYARDDGEALSHVAAWFQTNKRLEAATVYEIERSGQMALVATLVRGKDEKEN